MNVQQVNDTGPSISLFVYTSIVLLTISGLGVGFLFRHAMKRVLVGNVVPSVERKMEWAVRVWRGPPRMEKRIWDTVVAFCRSHIDKIRQR
jgi:hypothetical protein